MKTPTDAAFRISAARLRLMGYRSAGFLAEIGYSLKHEAAEIPTLCTDGRRVLYSVPFVDGISDTDLETILLHEYAHVALLHPARLDLDRHNRDKANIAMDYAVNAWVVKCGRTMPKGAYFDPKYDGMAWEHIYALMPDDEKHPDPDVQPMTGKDGGPATDAEKSEAIAELTDRIARIAQAQMMAGEGSADAKRILDQMNAPKDPDLYEALAALLQRAPNDHTWRKPNKRLLHCGFYPGLDGQECPPLVVVADTSGSITDAILAAFESKIRQAVADFRPQSIVIISCDDAISGTPETYTPDDLPAKLEFTGGGGTDFCPPFQWVAENMQEQPAALVYLTDLEGRGPDDAPDYPVIWAAIPGNSSYRWNPPYGQIVELAL